MIIIINLGELANFMVIFSSLDKLDPLDLEVDEIALQEWGKKYNGCCCPEARGYEIGDHLLLRLGIPLASKEEIGFERRGNLLTFLGGIRVDIGEEFDLRFIDYVCPVRIPEGYDLDSMTWCCGEDYAPHVRILIPKKTNV
jgi:hypothetical protein